MASGEPEFGDSISVETDSGTYSGIFVHQEPDFIFIKLGSGYNTGISRSRIRKVKLVQKRNVPEETTKVDGRKDGKGIAILSTGGTISSRVDYSTGGVKPSSTMDRLYSEELSRMHTVPVHYSSVSNILSENMTPELWVELARSIKKSLDREEGVVVFHGTDTMSYTSSAVAFMLREQTGTVVFTGSQRSPDRPSSDAFVNIESSIRFASIRMGEVGICMHGSLSDDDSVLLRSVRARKMHSSRRDAFRSIEFPPIGEIKGNSEPVVTSFLPAGESNRIMDKLDPDVGMLYFNPTLSGEDIERFVEGKKAVVIMGTGLGHVAERIIPSIEKITRSGVKVVMTSQCIGGIVDLNVYSTGKRLIKAGALGLGNILPEVAYVKAMFVLANYGSDEFEDMMRTNMRGEILERNLGGGFS